MTPLYLPPLITVSEFPQVSLQTLPLTSTAAPIWLNACKAAKSDMPYYRRYGADYVCLTLGLKCIAEGKSGETREKSPILQGTAAVAKGNTRRSQRRFRMCFNFRLACITLSLSGLMLPRRAIISSSVIMSPLSTDFCSCFTVASVS